MLGTFSSKHLASKTVEEQHRGLATALQVTRKTARKKLFDHLSVQTLGCSRVIGMPLPGSGSEIFSSKHLSVGRCLGIDSSPGTTQSRVGHVLHA